MTKGPLKALVLAAMLIASWTVPASPQTPTPDEEDDGQQTTHAPVLERLLLVPLPMGDRVVQLQARLCLPNSTLPATLVLINHGTPPTDHSKVRLGRCEQEAAQWFLSRGYAVAFLLRRGYGESGGDWAEGVGVSPCRQPDYIRAGLETAVDINAAVNFLTDQPDVKPSGVIIVGHSAGGWGALAYASASHPKVAAFVVMAGGRGGHRDRRAFNNCRPDLLAEAAAHYGKTARTPMLWIYTENDSYFPPSGARAV